MQIAAITCADTNTHYNINSWFEFERTKTTAGGCKNGKT